MVYSSKCVPIDKNPQHVGKCISYQQVLNKNYIDFTNGIKTLDVPRFEIIKPTLSKKVFEYSTDKDNDFNIVPLFVSENNEKSRILDLVLYKKLYILL